MSASLPRLPLKRLVSGVRPITYGIVQAGPDFPDGVPYIRPVDMLDEKGIAGDLRTTSPEIAAAYSRSEVAAGDIVVTIGPSYGKVMVVPESLAGANLTQGTARVAVRDPRLRRYVFWCLRSAETQAFWQREAQGATLRSVNLEELANTPIPMMAPQDAAAVAAFLDSETARMDALIGEHERAIALLRERRQALITGAVAGDFKISPVQQTQEVAR